MMKASRLSDYFVMVSGTAKYALRLILEQTAGFHGMEEVTG